MSHGRAFQAYKKTGIQTSGQKQLLVMMFDGMNRFINHAIRSIEEQDHEAAFASIQKAEKILLELMSTLKEKQGGEVGANMKKLYLYCYEQLVVANLSKDIKALQDVQQILGNLGQAWRQLAGGVGKTMKPSALPQKLRVTG